jgi:hypothetical protein
MAERIAVGDFVRFNQESVGDIHPRATDADVGAHTGAYVVTAYDKETKIAKISRQGHVFGEYPEGVLIKVEAPIDNTVVTPPDPPPPDTQVGGQAQAARPQLKPSAVNPFPPKGR